MSEYHIVEKRNRFVLHGIFDSYERAQRHLDLVIPDYVRKGYFMDKTLKADDFMIVIAKGAL